LNFSSFFIAFRDRLLETGCFYNLLQRAVGSRRARRYFVAHFAAMPSDARVLEIGCGPGTLIPFLPNHHGDYVGFDHNPQYIETARGRFPKDSFSFFRADLVKARKYLAQQNRRFDVVLAAAVLHHLDDREALDLVDLAATFCQPHGFFASFDGAIVEGEHPVAAGLLRADRGGHVRAPDAYEALLRSRFRCIKREVRGDLMRVPYSLVFFRAMLHSPL
jgi:SAM-dependent methyltransferase